jgi:heavy metal translocating P-type ATPase
MNACDLCGLPTGRHPYEGRFGASARTFCCLGCLNVYSILTESGVLNDSTDFRDTELYRESLRLGLISTGRSEPKQPIPEGAESREAVYHVTGMWCASCGWLIEHALVRERGVLTAEVMFASDLVKVKYCPQYIPPDRVPDRIAALGYHASEFDGQRESDGRERRDLLLRIGVAFFLWLNVMTLSLVIYASYWEAISDTARRLVPLVLMALTTPALFYSAWPILRSAVIGLRTFTLRMEALLALGISAAYVYSAVQAISGGNHLYFDTACAIITLVLLGKLLERGAKERTQHSISLLYRMMPKKARLLRDGVEHFVAVEALEPGMVFVVKDGERIPADGVVVCGRSHVDESVLTGESAPQGRGPGNEVIGGSLNTGGVLDIRASRSASAGALAQMIRAVESAMSSRSNIERLVDRVSRVFVPVVIVIAAATVIGAVVSGLPVAQALLRGIAVLVIACPCALGMATPLALTAAVGAAARRGILVSDNRVLETIRDVDVVVLDKTGTVTQGDFTVREFVLSPMLMAAGSGGDSYEQDWLSAVASLEVYSEHPLGRAVTTHAQTAGVAVQPASEVEIVKGMGIRGTVGGRRVLAGNRRMMDGLVWESGLEDRAAGWESQGYTVAFFGWEGVVAGAIALGDGLRPDAAHLVAELKRRGIQTALISGDAPATTAAIAASIGVDSFRAGVLPKGKLDAIRAWQAEGKTVAMVGDGVNDAPALATANLGIALGTGSDLAMQAAPVVLMTPSLDRVVEVFDISRATLRVVRQNLFWAFCYNSVGITLAVLGILNPILAAAAMVLSSVSVIGNSLRLGSRLAARK